MQFRMAMRSLLAVFRASSVLRIAGAREQLFCASLWNTQTSSIPSWISRARLSGTRRGRGGTLRLASVSAASKGETAVEDQQELKDEEFRSKNQSKRDSKRARQWGVELATFSPAQIKQVIRWAGLPDDVYDAVMIVKNLGSSSRVRNGRRRQYNYIGGLLRDVDSNVMEPVLKATKDGDVEGVILNSQALSAPATAEGDDEDYDEENWEDEDEEDSPKFVAEEWLHGLANGVSAAEDEVYSIYDVDYDRQELWKLVRAVRQFSPNDSSAMSEAGNANEDDSAVFSRTENKGLKARQNLRRFLINIAEQRVETLDQ